MESRQYCGTNFNKIKIIFCLGFHTYWLKSWKILCGGWWSGCTSTKVHYGGWRSGWKILCWGCQAIAPMTHSSCSPVSSLTTTETSRSSCVRLIIKGVLFLCEVKDDLVPSNPTVKVYMAVFSLMAEMVAPKVIDFIGG